MENRVETSRSTEATDPLTDQAVYQELRRLASRSLTRTRDQHTLQVTALVNEVWMRLRDGQPQEFQNLAQFYSVAATAMRRLVVEEARKRARGNHRRTEVLDEIEIAAGTINAEELLDIDAALTRLAQFDPRQCRVVELRFFAGLDVQEIGEVLGITARSVKRDWSLAKAWLFAELRDNRKASS